MLNACRIQVLLSRVTDSNLQYDFYITTDNDDELTNPSLKQLKIKLKSLYGMSDDRAADVEALKTQYQNDKDLIWIVPDNSCFGEVDKLVDEIERISYLEQKYNNPQSEEAPIIRNFATVRAEKENRVKDLIEQSLKKAVAIYLFNVYQLTDDNWSATMQQQQKQVIQNIYSKRLESQLADAIATSVIKEANNKRLHTYFHGNDFQFFDKTGNFVGENLRVVEEITFKIRNTFVEGGTIEKDLEQPPTGFTYGTIISTIAALMRAGKVMAKHGGSEKYSWKDNGVDSIFNAAREFRKASFKALTKSLSAQKRNDIVTILQGLKCEENTGKKIDWNSNDFDLANSIRDLAKCYCDKVDTLRKSNKEFDKLFKEVETKKDTLAGYTGSVSEQNYIEKAEAFIAGKDEFTSAVNEIEKVEKFIRNNLPKLHQWIVFCNGVNDELIKAATEDAAINKLYAEFNSFLAKDVVKEFSCLQQAAQKIKDEYFKLMQTSAENMTAKYQQLKKDTEALIKEIQALPPGLNSLAEQKAASILSYAKQRIQTKVEIDFDVKEKHSHFTYSEMLSFIDLYNTKQVELEIIKAGLSKEAPPAAEQGKPEQPPKNKVYHSKFPGAQLKISEYRPWLHHELQKLAGADDNDVIEIDNGTKRKE